MCGVVRGVPRRAAVHPSSRPRSRFIFSPCPVPFGLPSPAPLGRIFETKDFEAPAARLDLR